MTSVTRKAAFSDLVQSNSGKKLNLDVELMTKDGPSDFFFAPSPGSSARRSFNNGLNEKA